MRVHGDARIILLGNGGPDQGGEGVWPSRDHVPPGCDARAECYNPVAAPMQTTTFRVLLVSALTLAMACGILPEIPRFTPSSPAVGADQPRGGTAAAPNREAADWITRIPLHVGYGMRGPWFEVYFSDPLDPSAAQATGGLDELLVRAIEAARLSIHVAIYNLSLDNVRQSLIDAHRRGVEVQLVAESDNLDGDDFQRLVAAGIPVLGDRREGSMHDKFMVIDEAEVWTGSMNFTVTGAYQDNNTLVRINQPQLAAAYEAEFAEMFEGDQFGSGGGSGSATARVEIAGTLVEVYFAPEDRPEAKLVDLLDTAQNSIEFLAFSFTSDPLGDAIRRAAAAGISVRGVMDEDQGLSNTGTELAPFRAAGLDVRADGNPGQMHEKVLIIDREVVVVGSYNFSRSASESNDENLLIVHDPAFAGLFAEEFERVYAAAVP